METLFERGLVLPADLRSGVNASMGKWVSLVCLVSLAYLIFLVERYQSTVFFNPSLKSIFALNPNSFSA